MMTISKNPSFNQRTMATFFKAIVAICFLVEIISTTPLMGMFRRNVQDKNDKGKFERELKTLSRRIDSECKNLKHVQCGYEKIRAIKFEPLARKNCTTYNKVFCQVNRALNELNETVCNKTVSNIQPSCFLYGNANCNLPNTNTTVKEFCPKLKNYVEGLYNICT